MGSDKAGDMMRSFAIVLIGYNRLSGIQRLVKSLESADYGGRNDIHLIFSIDNSGNDAVENFAKEYQWPHGEKIIRTFPTRQGLKKHILSCGDYTEQYDIVTLLEDDIMVSDSFYHYAYQAADYYYDDDKIAGISLYNFQKNWLDWTLRFEPQSSPYDAYFLKVAQSWGQVWTAPKWRLFKEWYQSHEQFAYSETIPSQLFDWPQSSWLKYHDRYCIETDRYFVYPYVSLSTNFGDAGEHATFSMNDYQVELMCGKTAYSFPKFDGDAIVYDEYMNRVGLGQYCGVDDAELCVDFWKTKNSCLYKRYLLSTEPMHYEIVRRYALSLRPIELSVIKDIEGNGIYLYDTAKPAKNSRFNGKFNRLLYSLRSRKSTVWLKFACKLFVWDTKARLSGKLKKIMKKRKK